MTLEFVVLLLAAAQAFLLAVLAFRKRRALYANRFLSCLQLGARPAGNRLYTGVPVASEGVPWDDQGCRVVDGECTIELAHVPHARGVCRLAFVPRRECAAPFRVQPVKLRSDVDMRRSLCLCRRVTTVSSNRRCGGACGREHHARGIRHCDRNEASRRKIPKVGPRSGNGGSSGGAAADFDGREEALQGRVAYAGPACRDAFNYSAQSVGSNQYSIREELLRLHPIIADRSSARPGGTRSFLIAGAACICRTRLLRSSAGRVSPIPRTLRFSSR